MTQAAQFIQDGKRLDYTNSGSNAIDYLDVVTGTDKIFIAAEGIEKGATGALYAEGVFELPAKAADVLTFGQKLYYSATDGITSTAAGNIAAGYATEAKAASITTAKVKI